jgi:hypothetical protein
MSDKQLIILNNTHIYYIIKRFYSKFKLRRNRRNTGNKNPNILPYYIDDICYIKSYKFLCVYTDSKNIKRENLVVKYTYKNPNEIISLNIILDEYKDLLC